MFSLSLLYTPLIGLLIVSLKMSNLNDFLSISKKNLYLKSMALKISTLTFFISLFIFISFDFSNNQFQFVQDYSEIDYFNIYVGIDGLSVYFVLLTTIIMTISLLSNWTFILCDLIRPYLITILLLEVLLIFIFLVLDAFSFYIFFESILPPLFILIGLFGSLNRIRASFYLFLYTLWGSLFLLLAILKISSTMGFTDFDALYKTNFIYYLQLFLFGGIFLAFAVKTPTIFLNTWLLKAHVESPLSGSIILAGIVLKLSLYGIFRLILPLLPKAYIISTYLVYTIGVITIGYASMSTIRTIDVKELIAYSSVCHAAVYLMGVFSNTVIGIEGGILLGLAHGFVSSGLFICVGGVLYDRSSTRLITNYRGMAQLMPIFCIIYFILCLGNCGVPLTLNFIGEYMSLYGVFERQPFFGVLASYSIVFSAAYTIYLFNRTAFGGSYSKYFTVNIPDLNKREFYMLLTLVLFTVSLGIYPAPILDGIHYSATTLIYSSYWLVCIIPIFRIINHDKTINKVNLLYPPKPYAYVDLPLQSKSSYLILLTSPYLYFTYDNLPDVYDFSAFYITFVCVILVLIVFSCEVKDKGKGKRPMLSLDKDSNEGEGFKPNKKLVKKPNDDDNEGNTVDLAYAWTQPARGVGKWVVFDTNQASALRLKEIYHLPSYKMVDVNPNLKGIEMPYGGRVNQASNSSHTFRDGIHTLPDGSQAQGIWVPRPQQANAIRVGYNMTSRNRPIVYGTGPARNSLRYLFVRHR